MLHYIDIIALEGKFKVLMFTQQRQSHFSAYQGICCFAGYSMCTDLIQYNIDD